MEVMEVPAQIQLAWTIYTWWHLDSWPSLEQWEKEMRLFNTKSISSKGYFGSWKHGDLRKDYLLRGSLAGEEMTEEWPSLSCRGWGVGGTYNKKKPAIERRASWIFGYRILHCWCSKRIYSRSLYYSNKLAYKLNIPGINFYDFTGLQYWVNLYRCSIWMWLLVNWWIIMLPLLVFSVSGSVQVDYIFDRAI